MVERDWSCVEGARSVVVRDWSYVEGARSDVERDWSCVEGARSERLSVGVELSDSDVKKVVCDVVVVEEVK